MWRALHRLFGWQYVVLHAGSYSFVHRLRYSSGEGLPYVVTGNGIQFYDPANGLFRDIKWAPLTFNREDFYKRFGAPAALRVAA